MTLWQRITRPRTLLRISRWYMAAAFVVLASGLVLHDNVFLVAACGFSLGSVVLARHAHSLTS